MFFKSNKLIKTFLYKKILKKDYANDIQQIDYFYSYLYSLSLISQDYKLYYLLSSIIFIVV